MSDQPDDIDWNEAKGVTCPECQAPYEMVRPGKIQPTCLCEAFDVECRNHAETRRWRDTAEKKCRALELQTDELNTVTNVQVRELDRLRRELENEQDLRHAAERQRDRATADLMRLATKSADLERRYDDLLDAAVAKLKFQDITKPIGPVITSTAPHRETEWIPCEACEGQGGWRHQSLNPDNERWDSCSACDGLGGREELMWSDEPRDLTYRRILCVHCGQPCPKNGPYLMPCPCRPSDGPR